MNRTELYVKRFYKLLNINYPYQLTVDNLSNKMNIPIFFWEFTSEITKYRGRYKLFINESLNEQQQWQDFGHEISHFLQHTGSQTNMYNLFLNYQESQADYFAYHFCVPTFMLIRLKEVTIYDVMNQFNVEHDFAYTRLEMHQNKILSRGNSIALQTSKS